MVQHPVISITDYNYSFIIIRYKFELTIFTLYIILKKFRIGYLYFFGLPFSNLFEAYKNYLIMLNFLILFITKSEYYPSYTITIIPCTLFYYDLKPLFLHIRKWESGTLQKWGRSAMKDERSAMLQTFSPWGKVCNVPALPTLPGGGGVCNVANLLGEACKYNTGIRM